MSIEKIEKRNEPTTQITVNDIAELNRAQVDVDTKKPCLDIAKDTISVWSKYASFITSFVTSLVFILEQLHLSPIITTTPNFIVIPIISVVAFLLFFCVPNSVNHLRSVIEKRLKNKKTANAHELNEINSIIQIVTDCNETLSSATKTNAKSIVIKPETPRESEVPEPYDTESEVNVTELVVRDGTYYMFVDNFGNRYIRVTN